MQEETGPDELMQKARQHAAEAAKSTADQARQTAKGVWSEAKSATSVLQSLVFEDYVKENPAQALLIAVGVGIVIGLLLRR
ncbi:MAG TPA: hypothetical protein VGH55_07665 [Chthoniobacterales bacterium]|jgi:ElaB/YqjD/DUF883 family membrane-anchored ribosome-binding protein